MTKEVYKPRYKCDLIVNGDTIQLSGYLIRHGPAHAVKFIEAAATSYPLYQDKLIQKAIICVIALS